MGDWLIGVYKGGLITASDEEAGEIAGYNRLGDTLNYVTDLNRTKLRPYFFMLAPVERAEIIEGDKNLFEGYGLNNIAYKCSEIEPIPAYGCVEKGCFMSDSKHLNKRYFDKLKLHYPDEKSRVCVLALKTKGFWVRTGTFFRFTIDGDAIRFEPFVKGNKYLVGKGVLLGINRYRKPIGTMRYVEARNEMLCPASKCWVQGTNDGWNIFNRGKFFMVYRQVSSDLRADMPLALLKVSQIDGAFESMFKALGESLEYDYDKFGRLRTKACEVNIQLDGTIVDYANVIGGRAAEKPGTLEEIKGNIRGTLFYASLISVAGKKALVAMAGGKKSVKRIVEENGKEVYGRYKTFFEKFAEGGGEKVKEKFGGLGGPENVSDFFRYRERNPLEFWNWRIWTKLGWGITRKIT